MNFTNKNMLITGATGFVGSYLAKELLIRRKMFMAYK
jgi:thioester reductase-like protein